MKFFSVIVLAALCATAVTAAPPSTSPNFPFEQYGLSNILEGIGDKLNEYWQKVECTSKVIAKAVQDSEVKSAWDEAKAKLDTLANVEWKKCSQITDIAGQAQCKAQVVGKASEVIGEFFQKLAAEAKWELVKEIKEAVVAQCFEDKATFFDLDDETEDVFQVTIPEQFECLVDVLGEVSKANGLEELWSKTEPQLRNRLSAWKQCPNAGNKFLVILCNVKEGVATYRLLTEYIRLAAAENPQVIQDFAQQIQQRCSGQTYAKIMAQFAENNGHQVVEKVKCISEAITDAVKETDFQTIWDEYKKDVEQLNERVKACKNQPTNWEAAKCVAEEIKSSQQILAKFLANLKQANQETYDRVHKYIKQRCFA